MKQYYVKRGESASGPFRAKKLKKAARLGKLLRDDLLGYTLEGPWRKAETISALGFPDNVDEPLVAGKATSLATPVEEELALEAIDAPPVTTVALSSTEDDPFNADPLGPISADPLGIGNTQQAEQEAAFANLGKSQFDLKRAALMQTQQIVQQSPANVTALLTVSTARALLIAGVLVLLYAFFGVDGPEWQFFAVLGGGLVSVSVMFQGFARTAKSKKYLADYQSNEALTLSRNPPAVCFDFHVNDMAIMAIDIGKVWNKAGKVYPFCFDDNWHVAISIVVPPKNASPDEEVRLVKGENPNAVIAKINESVKGRPRIITDAQDNPIGICALIGSRSYATWLVRDLQGNNFLCKERSSGFSRLIKALMFWNDFSLLICTPLGISQNGLHIGNIEKNRGPHKWTKRLLATKFSELTKQMDYRLLCSLLVLHQNSSESPVDL
jgi:hypothetical protein